MLKTETNTRDVQEEATATFCAKFDAIPSDLQVDFEHGQWWVTVKATGAQYSVVDCERSGADYLDFEQVSAGEED